MMWVAWTEDSGSSAVGWRLKTSLKRCVSAIVEITCTCWLKEGKIWAEANVFQGWDNYCLSWICRWRHFCLKQMNRSSQEASQSKYGLAQYIFCSDGLSALLFTIKVYLPIILLVGQADCASLWCNQVSPVRCFGAVVTEPWLVNILAGPRHPLRRRGTP